MAGERLRQRSQLSVERTERSGWRLCVEKTGSQSRSYGIVRQPPHTSVSVARLLESTNTTTTATVTFTALTPLPCPGQPRTLQCFPAKHGQGGREQLLSLLAAGGWWQY